MIKIHIIFDFKENPWGGGNQFLKALKNKFILQGIYTDSITEADVVLFNSHHCLNDVFLAKAKYPKKIFVHRLDGIMKLTRNDIALDKKIYNFNRKIANATIFQSQWAKEQAKKAGYVAGGYEKIIINAPDPHIFNKKECKNQHSPIRLIANSWSTNFNKGFLLLKWLDENLDFNKYQLTFVGNTPFTFKNIKCFPPQPSNKLSCILKEHDIYIFPSKNDACSNSLIEALHCGLPAVYLLSGGNSEIAQGMGEGFCGQSDIVDAIDKVSMSYQKYQEAIRLPSIDEVSAQYKDFFIEIKNSLDKATFSYTKDYFNTKNILFLVAGFSSRLLDKATEKASILTRPFSIKGAWNNNARKSSLKIALGYEIKDGPWGGGNQFLRSFKGYFEGKGFQVVHQLEKDLDLIIMINPRRGSGTFNHKDVKKYKKYYPAVKVIHRINETDKAKNTESTDKLRIEASRVADGVVFISQWLKSYYLERGFNKNILHTVIVNGADKNIFNQEGHNLWNKNQPLKVVTHHWSDNVMKGADIYQYFDILLEDPWMRKNFEFTYIGCLPQGVNFKHTNYIKPLFGKELANEIKKHHVYLTAARWESCGMHPIEGACCGLPVLFIDEGGGMVEVCKDFGIQFTKETFLLGLLKIRDSYFELQERVKDFPLESMRMNKKYEEFIFSLLPNYVLNNRSKIYRD